MITVYLRHSTCYNARRQVGIQTYLYIHGVSGFWKIHFFLVLRPYPSVLWHSKNATCLKLAFSRLFPLINAISRICWILRSRVTNAAVTESCVFRAPSCCCVWRDAKYNLQHIGFVTVAQRVCMCRLYVVGATEGTRDANNLMGVFSLAQFLAVEASLRACVVAKRPPRAPFVFCS